MCYHVWDCVGTYVCTWLYLLDGAMSLWWCVRVFRSSSLTTSTPLSWSSVTAQKRACNTATCVTHRLADFLSRSGGMGNSNFVPTNVGSKAFGRRRRNTQLWAFQPPSGKWWILVFLSSAFRLLPSLPLRPSTFISSFFSHLFLFFMVV